MIRLVYITCANKMEAQHIGRELLLQKKVACVNILENIHAMYLWEGSLVEDTETILIAKTSEDKVEMVIEIVKSLHSYTVPCVVVLPIVAGNEDYLTWVKTVTT